MWIKSVKGIWESEPGAIFYRDANKVRVAKDKNIFAIAAYQSAERARQVMEGFWLAAAGGKAFYEFPEE